MPNRLPGPTGPAPNHERPSAAPRLPLLTVSASRIGRAVILQVLARTGKAVKPPQLAGYLASPEGLGWRPSDDTLYNSLLAPLTQAGGSDVALQVRSEKHGPYHRHTLYRITPAGRQMLEAELQALGGPGGALLASRTALSSLCAFLGDPGPTQPKRSRDTSDLMRLLILRMLAGGPLKPAAIGRQIAAAAGNVSWTPPGAAHAELWPRRSLTYRYLFELEGEPYFAVAREGRERTLRPDGQALSQHLLPGVQAGLLRALEFVERAGRALFGWR